MKKYKYGEHIPLIYDGSNPEYELFYDFCDEDTWHKSCPNNDLPFSESKIEFLYVRLNPNGVIFRSKKKPGFMPVTVVSYGSL